MGAQVRYWVLYYQESTNDAISTYHNAFEKHHRFVGWLGLAVRTCAVPHVIKLTVICR